MAVQLTALEQWSTNASVHEFHERWKLRAVGDSPLEHSYQKLHAAQQLRGSVHCELKRGRIRIQPT